MSAFATVTRNTLLEHELFTRIFEIKFFYVSIAIANSISLEYCLSTSWQNLNKIGCSEQHKIWIICVILKEVLHVNK